MDEQAIRKEFPILDQEIQGNPLIYFDNAATSQKPRRVIQSLVDYYQEYNSNVHRGIHTLSMKATMAYEGTRKRAVKFLNAKRSSEIIFTRGTTEAINLVAYSWGREFLKAGDKILLTEMEHHSNIVPWQLIAAEKGATLEYVPITGDDGLLDLSVMQAKLNEGGIKICAFTHISNTLGTVNPVEEMCRLAREAGAATLVDAAQSGGHAPLDVQAIGCDFLALSGHKMCAPTGIGLLYGREEILEKMQPWQGGGDMISRVDFYESKWNSLPHKFEAGTPNIADAIALKVAMDFLDEIGRENILAHDQDLAGYAYEKMSGLDGLKIFGPNPATHKEAKSGVISFELQDVHAHDVVTLADQYGLALRGGHHCNQPLMKRLGVTSTARASFYFYNTRAEIDRMLEILKKIREFFNRGL